MAGALRILFGWSPGGAPDGLAARQRRVVLTASALAVVALLPPLVSLGVPRALASLGPPRTGIVLVSALLLAPALAGLAFAVRGLDQVVAGFAAQPDGEHRQTIQRVFVAAGAFAYALAATAPAASGGGAPLPTVAALALLAAWLFLLHMIVAPVAPPLRRHLAMTADIGFLSGFLCAGGEAATGWYPLYLAIAVDNGLRSGLAALVAASLVGAGGFALVAVATPFWQQHLALSVGLGAALLGLPALLVRPIRGVAAAQQAARSEGEAKNRLLAALGDALGAAFEPVMGLAATLARNPLSAEQRGLVAALQSSADGLMKEVDELRALAASSGVAPPAAETFDLHAVINDAVALLRLEAAEKGLSLALRVDPNLPWLLRGSPAQLRRVLGGLIGSAIKRTESGKVRVGFDAVGGGAERVGVRITVRDQGGAAGGLGLAIVRELVALMGGRMTIDSAPPKPGLVAVELAFAPAAVTPAPSPDLRQRPVLIASEDAEFAGGLVGRIRAWGGDAAWIGGFEAALAHLRQPNEARPVVILDGRAEVLQALSLADRAASLSPQRPPHLLFIAEAAWLDSLAGLADGELAAILPMPLTDRLLANALHALPIDGDGAAVDAGAAEATAAGRARPGGAPRLQTILVAEDSAANRAVTERVLSLAGYQVVLAANGEEALAALEADGIDLVLMDIGMPRINGYEAARLYRMMRARPPIIALTGDASPETERLCREAGMDGVLTKPIAPERLVAAVEAALGAGAPGKAASVTPITSHPRFAGDSPAPVDERAVEQLQSLGAGSSFFRDVVEAFRSDALDILDAIARAAADCDAGAFREGVHALRSCAANVGGMRLCELLQSMQEPTARDLRQQGTLLVQRLGTELAKLDAALLDYLAETEKSRR